MAEFFPLISSAVLGWLLWRGTEGRLRVVLALIGVLSCSFSATIVSGEYEESWAFFVIDLFEAVVGMAVGAAVARWMKQRSQSAAATRGLRATYAVSGSGRPMPPNGLGSYARPLGHLGQEVAATSRMHFHVEIG